MKKFSTGSIKSWYLKNSCCSDINEIFLFYSEVRFKYISRMGFIFAEIHLFGCLELSNLIKLFLFIFIVL